MPKTKISEFSATPGNNTDIDGINLAEGCAPSGINDAIRELMAQLKDFQSGGAGDPITVVGTLAAAGTSSVAGDLKLYEQTTNGTNYAGFKSPTSLAANIQWVLPNADGTNGQALTTNGSGTLAWSTIAASPGGSNTQVQFNNSGAFGGSANFTFDGSNLQIGSQGDLRLGDSDNSNWVAFQAPATVASNVTWTLPSADGTNGQALVTNGSGTLSFSTISTSAATPTALGTVYGLTQDTSGTANTVLGYQSLNANTTGNSNVAIGVRAVYTNSTGSGITGVGYNALYNSTGSNNTALGSLALLSNTTGASNTAVGTDALRLNTTASNNTAVGYQAAYSNTTGATDTALGAGALYSNTTGSLNVAVGYEALYNNTTAGWNTAVGDRALRANTTGARNTAVGRRALTSNTTGSENVAIGAEDASTGYGPLWSNTTGQYNVAVGNAALGLNTTASNNTAVGYQALYSNTTASSNTAVGFEASRANTTGTSNTSIGYLAGRNNTTGTLNTAVGSGVLQSNSGTANTGVGVDVCRVTTGSYNTGVGSYDNGGYSPLWSNTSGQYNIGIGNGALGRSTTASENIAVGYQSLSNNTTGGLNTAVGTLALALNTTGASNAAVGYSAGYSTTTGVKNVYVGESAGYDTTTGNYNVYIGHNVRGSGTTNTSEINIAGSGNAATYGKGSNTGYINPNGGGVYQGNNSSSWSTTSDFRLKKNIVDNNEGLEKIAAIRVRNFEYRLPEEVTDLPEHTAIAKTGVQLGVIAQELQQVCPDCVKEESTGVLSVDSDNVFWHMVNAIKQLKTELDTVKAELQTLKGN